MGILSGTWAGRTGGYLTSIMNFPLAFQITVPKNEEYGHILPPRAAEAPLQGGACWELPEGLRFSYG